MAITLGILLIGQSPRPEYESYFRNYLPDDAVMITVGALDQLSLAEIEAFTVQSGEEVLATLSRDRVPITVPAREVNCRIPEKIVCLEAKGVDLIVLACTGEFPPFQSKVPLLLPSEILTKNVVALAAGKQVIVLIPLPEQVGQLGSRWSAAGVSPVMVPVSPFTQRENLSGILREINQAEAALIVLDCMGYDPEMKEAARTYTGKPVMAARTLLGKVIAELTQ